MSLFLEYAERYGVTLVEAEYNPSDEWAEDVRHLMLRATGKPENLECLTWRDMPDRRADGLFFGCSNRAWVVSAEEANRLRALNTERSAKAPALKKVEEVEAQEMTPTCPKCGTWCYGDCEAN